MKEKYLINGRIIDPKNKIDEIGGLIIDSKGLIMHPHESYSMYKASLCHNNDLKEILINKKFFENAIK